MMGGLAALPRLQLRAGPLWYGFTSFVSSRIARMPVTTEIILNHFNSNGS